MKNECFIARLTGNYRVAIQANHHKSHANLIFTIKDYDISLVGLQRTYLLRNFTTQPGD